MENPIDQNSLKQRLLDGVITFDEYRDQIFNSLVTSGIQQGLTPQQIVAQADALFERETREYYENRYNDDSIEEQ